MRTAIIVTIALACTVSFAQPESGEPGQTSPWVYVGEAGGGLVAGTVAALGTGIAGVLVGMALFPHADPEASAAGGLILGAWAGAPAGMAIGTWGVGAITRHPGSLGKTIGWAYVPHAVGAVLMLTGAAIAGEFSGEPVYEGPRSVAEAVLIMGGFYGSLAAAPVVAIVAHDRSNPDRLSGRFAPPTFALVPMPSPDGGRRIALRARLLSIGI